jgi:hypothetical protein
MLHDGIVAFGRAYYACRVPATGSSFQPDTIVFRERNAGLNLGCGGMALLWALPIAGFAWLSRNSNLNLQVYSVFGILFVITVLGWIGGAGRLRLEVGRDAITTRSGWRRGSATLTCDKGDTLRIIPDGMLYGKRPSGNSLIALGTGAIINLYRLDPDEVQRACEAQGWSFDGDAGLAVKDVRCYLNSGKVRQAARVTDVLGPFPGAAADGKPGLALEAAVFEAYGDSLNHTSADFGWGGARRAYERALDEQKAFAAAADSSTERAARDTETLRLEEKRRTAGP